MIYFPDTRLVLAPQTEPLTLTEAKAQVKVTHDADDDYLTSLALGARRYFEVKYNRALICQHRRMWLPCFPCGDTILIPFGQLRAIKRFAWTDSAGTVREWTPALGNLVDSSSVARAHIDLNREPGAITLAYSQSWPTETLKTVAPIEIEFVCGWDDAASVPEEIKQGMRLLIGHWYRNREAVVISDRASVESMPLPMGVAGLFADYALYYS